MQNKRYIKILALQIDNKLVPFWQLEYTNSEKYGEGFREKDLSREHYQDLTECVWDCKKKEIKSAVVKDYFPDQESEDAYRLGESVLVQVKGKYDTYSDDKIKEIFYEDFESEFYTAKRLKELGYYRKLFSEEELNSGNLYEIRKWKPYYKMMSGKVIKWEHELKHKAKD